MGNKKLILSIVIILVLVVSGIGFWYWSQKEIAAPKADDSGNVTLETPATGDTKDGLGAEVFKKTNNPLSNELPETNPFHVDINPFK